MKVSIEVNGQTQERDVEPRITRVDFASAEYRKRMLPVFVA